MRSNEIELLLRNQGMERGVRSVLFRLAEEIEDIQRTLKELTETLVAVSTVVEMLNGVADNMKDAIDRLKPKDNDPRSTREMLE
jgi:hypothetical protein